MRSNLPLHLLICFCVVATGNFLVHGEPMPDTLFNDNWTFYKGELTGAESPDFDDSKWENVTLPHDYAIKGPFSDEYNARIGGLPAVGSSWYRKQFEVPSDWKGKRVSIEFDGVMMNSNVYVNGKHVGYRPYGYIGFEYDITDHLKYGEPNLIAVSTKFEVFAMRWYPGAGIYRNVHLKVNAPIRIPQWGTFVTTPLVTANEAVVDVQTDVKSDCVQPREGRLVTHILDVAGKKILTDELEFHIHPESVLKLEQNFRLQDPLLWDLGQPNLYTAISEVYVGDKMVDTYETEFGIRYMEFDADEGFSLNDKKVQLNGVCMHHDLGPLGAAVNYRATERQMQIMQSMGVNSLRTSHNPPSPEMLQVCDRLGILVIVEAFDEWKIGKVANGYHKYWDDWHEIDLRSMIRRDRNHPSVFMWSIGNEILEQGQKDGWKLAKRLTEICHEEDLTRPTTVGFNYYPAPFENKLAYYVDIVGMNYWSSKFGDIKKRHPNMIVYGSETSSMTSSRGKYMIPWESEPQKDPNFANSYDVLVGPPWATPPDGEFKHLEENPGVLGEYIWTGFDYLGEPTPYSGRDNHSHGYWNDDWPSRSSYFAPVDLCGFPKDRYYLYQSQWTETPMVHVLPHWNWEGREGETIPVVAYTNCEEVELFVNGKSQGKRTKGEDTTTFVAEYYGHDKGPFESKYRLSWEVPYQPGSIKVVAYNGGKKVATKVVKTAGKPAKLELIADRSTLEAGGDDLAFITVNVLDKKGNLCPLSDDLIKFEVSGAGELAAVGNGDQTSLKSFFASERHAFSGKCLAIVRTSENAGKIQLKASGEGLATQVITLKSE